MTKLASKPHAPIKLRPFLSKHKNFFLALAGIILLSLLSQGLYHWILGANRPAGPFGLAIQTVRVKSIPMPKVVETVGSLLPLEQAKLTAAITGKVDKILVASGSKVKKSTPLLSLVGIANVLAPMDGSLTDWKVKPGEFVSAGSDLIEIVNTAELSVHYRIPEQYAKDLENGQTVTLSFRGLPGQEFTGKVQFISPLVDRKTHTILLHADVHNPDQKLWPGMFARLRHILSIENNALVLPESALNLTLEGYEILVVKQNKLVRMPVTLGTRDKDRVQILSGVEAGDQVLLTKTDATKEGMPVIAHDWTGDW